ncbi:MAG TPA: PQQ-dependent sugar dehydrogenase, partial [Bacteroidia bacterium]|nr:PQQ-dependent sugar dehydrogenase [Bacteroidia bacterium]
MKYLIFTFATIISLNCKSQTFLRSELTTSLSTPWEITYGQDNYLWLTESGGRVSRIDPTVGTKTVVYTAADYFGGSAMEQSTLCFQPNIGAGTLGLTLHPDFPNVNSSYIYFVYSYNNGTVSAPDTKFKIVRLTWDVGSSSVIANTDLVTQL